MPGDRTRGGVGRATRALALVAAACALLAPAAEALAAPGRLPAACGRTTPLDPTSGGLAVASPDGAVIAATLYLPGVATVATPVPVVLHTHGGGGTRAALAPRAGNLTMRLLNAGYGVLVYDTRGHGGSRWDVFGRATPAWGFAARATEVEDARALLRQLASCAAIAQESPGDPRAGWVGASNGGAIQVNAAAEEPIVDAIVPELAWGELPEELAPAGAPKELGVLLHDALASGGVQLDPMVSRWNAEVVATGALSAGVRGWLAERSTSARLARVAAPALFVQGSADTLFGLAAGLRGQAALAARGVPAKLLVVCAAHGGVTIPAGTCPASPADAGEATLAWLDRHVRGLPTETGPAIEWQAQDGRVHAASAPHEPSVAVSLPAAGEPPLGRLAGTAGTGGDSAHHAAPAPAGEGIRRALLEARACAPLLGAPRLALEGELAGEPAHVFAELVEAAPGGARRTLGAQATPVALPAGRFALEAELASVAWTLAPGARLELELTAGSAAFREPQRSFSVALERATVRLPLGEPGSC